MKVLRMTTAELAGLGLVLTSLEILDGQNTDKVILADLLAVMEAENIVERA